MIRLPQRRQNIAVPVLVTAGAVLGATGLAYLVGQGLAYLSLVFGILFFVYAARYYVAILAVLIAPSVGATNGKNGGGGPTTAANGNNGYPMISVHLAIYNEERVVDRLLTACSKLDYPNYEVIVVDDSKDGTVRVLKQWILKQLESNKPKFKIIHRENRSGFKGGALNEALRHTSSKAEFVAVFDADFVPQPDILKKFLAYFNRHAANGSGNGNPTNNGNGNSNGRYSNGKLAAVQGYQWHTLNRSENWLTKGISCEFSGNYMVDRTFQEVTGMMKMVAGSVYMIRADLLRECQWSSSITEDWELTLRLYEAGHKVLYTPLIQAPGECPSTLGKLVKQRMRWAEGHTYNVKKHFFPVLLSTKLGIREKLEFLYFAPYYLQSVFLILGTLFWFSSDAVIGTRLPFWTQTFGWGLVFTNLLALPLMSLTGLFFEKRAKKDFPGLFSQFLLTYALSPYQAFAALKGLLEPIEGSWVRTFKSGKLAGFPGRLEPRKVIKNVLPPKRGPSSRPLKVPVLVAIGLAILLGAAFAQGAFSTSEPAQPAYYFYNQPAPAAYHPFSYTPTGASFLMHTPPPNGVDTEVSIGPTQGSGPLFFSDPAPTNILLPFGASVSIHVWVETGEGGDNGLVAPGPQWATTTQTSTTTASSSEGTLNIRIDLYNPANNSIMQIPGASETEALALQPGLNYYEASWGNIAQGKALPKGVTLVTTVWCPDCKTSPFLLFNSEWHPSRIDFPIEVPENSLSVAAFALTIPGIAGLVVDYRKGRSEEDKRDSGEGGLRRVQRSLIIAAAVILLTLPLVITFNSMLTSLATYTGFNRVVSSIVPYESGAVADLLRGLGVQAGSNGGNVWLSGGFVPVVAFIDWNCAGWQGFALFGLTSIGGLGSAGNNSRKAVVIVAGILGIFAVNVFRILLVVLLGYYVSYPLALVFHDYGGTILTLVWLLIFWAVVLRRKNGSLRDS